MKKTVKKHNKIKLPVVIRASFWFLVGSFLGLFFSISFAFIFFQRIYIDRIFPGIYINNMYVGGKTEAEIAKFLDSQNSKIAGTQVIFKYNDQIISTSAENLKIGYNSKLLAHQAFLIGRSNYIFSDIVLVFKAYLDGVFLSPSFNFSSDKLDETLKPISQKVEIDPVDALFTFQNGKVTTFQPSSDGQKIDIDKVENDLNSKIPLIVISQSIKKVDIQIALEKIKPKVETGDANNMGIKELIGQGTSLFQHSIASRIYNVTLAANRLNGVLVAPNEEFSFARALGDVSKFTGYQQAYVIENGKTVLGDGGGVCQVSTTMFRAILNAGLPVTERHAHAYRVGYYEEDSPPGIDATVYVPSVDLRFRNDTGHYILIQTAVDPSILRLTFYLYGTSDGRKVSMTTPVITRQTPAPPPVFTDDPTLPAGVLKQVDFAAAGADVEFTRTVVDNQGKVMYNDTFVSDYQPWHAAYLRGTGT